MGGAGHGGRRAALERGEGLVSAGPVGVLGGTFDPVHFGHLRSALEAYEELGLSAVHMIPCRDPVHRQAPGAGAAHRRAMLAAALAGQSALRLDVRELERETPSYTLETLQSLRAELGDSRPLCLLVGQDAFAGLNEWHRWRELVGYAHIVVLTRPGADLSLPETVDELWRSRQTAEPRVLREAPAGCIHRLAVTRLAISASEIRRRLAQGGSPRYLVPEAVADYIVDHRLYR